MEIRAYKPKDCEEIARLFYETVHTVNAKDYTQEQQNVWATGQVDLDAWNRSFLEHMTLVAEEDGQITGFGDMDQSGYLDRLYVHKNWQGRGIATAICDGLEAALHPRRLKTQASITAMPFFLRRGWHVVRKQQVERNGIFLTNYVMEKHLSQRESEET